MITDAPEWVYSFRGGSPKRAAALNLGPLPAYVKPSGLVERALANLGRDDAWSAHNEARVRGALAVIEPDIDGQTWVSIGSALFDLEWITDAEDIGFELWNEWSKESKGEGAGNGQYRGRENLEARWKTFENKNFSGARFTIASIFKLASERGWKGELKEKPKQINGHHALPDSFNAQPQAIVFVDHDKNGKATATCRNAVAAIRGLGLTCELDKFHDRYHVGGQAMNEWVGELSDEVVQIVRVMIRETYTFDPGTTNTCDALIQECLAHSFHPIKDYFGTLQWDGVRRLDTWVMRYLGAVDTPFHRATGRLALVAATRRVLQPGCKFDHIVVLEGPEGRGKSSAIEILAGAGNFSDQTLLNVDDRAQQEALSGVWLYEIADLAGHSRAEVERVKAFASRTHDRARPAYGRRRVDRARTCVLFATTNDSTYLQSQTGNRRFWPWACGRIDLEALRRDRDQLWAEALRAETDVSIFLPESLWGEAAVLQDMRREHDPWDDELSGDLGVVVPTAGGNERRVMTFELMTRLEIAKDRQSTVAAKRIASAMRRLGWDGPKVIKTSSGTPRGYTKPA